MRNTQIIQPIFKTTLIIGCIVASIFFISCHKSGNSENGSFTWSYKGTNYVGTWFTAYTSSMAATPIIIAGLGENVRTNWRVSIAVTSFNVGTYTFGPGSGNTFYYLDDTRNPLNVTNGTVNITVNNNNVLGGTFVVTVNESGTNNQLTGSFTTVPIRP